MKAKKEDNVVIFGMENSQKLAQEIGKYLNKEILQLKLQYLQMENAF